jgi:7-cyano-7-deazaguanine reductase
MQVENSLLGQSADYPTRYAPELLFAIARAPARQAYADLPALGQGMDWWHVFEISWLDPQGIPQVAMARLHIPATSENLIESKSLKLYFNSFNFEKLSRTEFIDRVEQDLSAVAQAPVRIELFDLEQLPMSAPFGQCLDQLHPTQIEYQPNADLLQHQAQHTTVIEQSFYSHLLRSNCPVTNQPDWGTVFIRYQGQALNANSLLAYIISYRQHNGFHEQCVEQIFAHIWQQLQPEKLMVYAAYTRRGGLDINPCRVSDWAWMPQPLRLARQ